MKDNVNVLDEINKGATMGMDAIHFTLDKVQGEELRKTLELEYNKYKDISRRVNDIYPGDKEPHETNVMTKAMTWYGIEMKTFMDNSDSKIAELLLQGTNMGIIEGRKLLNNKDMDNNTFEILNEFITMQEDSVEQLKRFL